LEQQLNHLVTGAISDCVGAQILQFVPLLAAMSTGGSNSGSIAAQLAAALVGGALFAMFVASFHAAKTGGEKCSRVAELEIKGGLSCRRV